VAQADRGIEPIRSRLQGLGERLARPGQLRAALRVRILAMGAEVMLELETGSNREGFGFAPGLGGGAPLSPVATD
jgi:hypothetical protein